MSSRGQSYTTSEDIHLCRVWLDISQNPIIGTNQSKETFWKRVTSEYNKQKPNATMQDRTDRSCHCRMNLGGSFGKLSTHAQAVVLKMIL